MDTTQIIAIFIFAFTMFAIMTEKVHRMTAALAGAVMMIVFGVLDIESSLQYIDADTICILVSMMIFVGVVKKSGLFEFIAVKAAKLSGGRPWVIMVSFMLITAILSAFLDNVTTVLLVGPMTFAVTRALNLDPVPFIITEIMASNIGGTGTLIGDPPNIMIGSSAHFSFMDFILNVGPPVLVVLGATILSFYFIYGKRFPKTAEDLHLLMEMDEIRVIKDESLMKKSVAMIILLITAFSCQDLIGLSSAVIALIFAVVMLLIGKQDIERVIDEVEWPSIVFFIGLFIVVGGLQDCGVISLLANLIVRATEGNPVMTMIVILWASAILSSFLDNIPFVATMIPLILTMESFGVQVEPLWWALSLGACLGGNGTIIGASANVVLSGITARQGYCIRFREYMKIGFPLMLLSMGICTVYLYWRFA
ncbi:MAG: ArsB/NhaD family transporter [Firmicutes bacterium]|nr:ArsB/NhaD family transporter [Bacillota bacterium]